MNRGFISLLVCIAVATFWGCEDNNLAGAETKEDNSGYTFSQEPSVVTDSLQSQSTDSSENLTPDKTQAAEDSSIITQDSSAQNDTQLDSTQQDNSQEATVDSIYRGPCTENAQVPGSMQEPDWWFGECIQPYIQKFIDSGCQSNTYGDFVTHVQDRKDVIAMLEGKCPAKATNTWTNGCTLGGILPEGYQEPDWWLGQCVMPNMTKFLDSQCSQETMSADVKVLLVHYSAALQPVLAKKCPNFIAPDSQN